MIEILPIKSLRDEDSTFFGGLNVTLGKLTHFDVSVAPGIVVTAPQIKLKTTLEHLDFGSKEVFEQNLTIFKKELEKIPVPENLQSELKKHKKVILNNQIFTTMESLWHELISIWVGEIRHRLWTEGFGKGITENLQPQLILYLEKVDSFGTAIIDPIDKEVLITNQFGNLDPKSLKEIEDLILQADKKLLLPYTYHWILSSRVYLSKLSAFVPPKPVIETILEEGIPNVSPSIRRSPTTVKVYLDFSQGYVYEKEVDGIYIQSEKIIDLNNLRQSFEDLSFRLIESGNTFPDDPILLKLADIPEDRGGVRGTLRLLHNKNLLDILTDSLLFSRYKYKRPNGSLGFHNIHLVIPFVRNEHELMEIKRELAVRKILRKNSFEMWMEVAIPENVLNFENYLATGLDGIVINLDELISFFGGFDHSNEQISFYKKEVSGLIKFMQPFLKQLHKSKLKFICVGNLCFDHKMLEFLIENGVYGIVAPKYEAPSISNLLHQVEKKVVLNRLNP